MSMGHYYGCTFFRATQNCTKLVPEKVILGVCAKGLNIYDRKRELVSSFNLEEIFRWGFKTNVLFYFEVRMKGHEDLTMLDFDSPEGQTISDLMTDYALIRVKEMETLEVEGIDDVEGEEMHPHTIAATTARAFTDPSQSAREDIGRVSISASSANRSKLKASDLLALSQEIGSNPKSLTAIIKIQAFARGVNARARVTEMIERMFETGELSVGGSDDEQEIDLA